MFGTSPDGGFYVVHTASGAIVDSHLLSGFGAASAVAIGKGYVWMDDASGTVYAFGAPGAGVMASIQTGPGSTSLPGGFATPVPAQALDLGGNPSPGGPYRWAPASG